MSTPDEAAPSPPVVLLHVDARGVATLTLNRPEIHNAFDDRLIAELAHKLREAANDPDVRAIVLAANGKSFSAGADLNWMKRMARYSEGENLRDAVGLADLMHTISALPKPAVARVQGPAYGGGVGLVACCDIAVGSHAAAFSLSEVRLGLIPAVISPHVIAAIGERQARRYFLTAERFDAAEALRIGLLHAVVEEGQLDAALNAILDQLLKGGPKALAAAKSLIASVANRPIDRGLVEDTAERIARIRVTAEGREGIAAFLEKRPPAWVKKTSS
jgi:methylglutaconyl-CoA hydratase